MPFVEQYKLFINTLVPPLKNSGESATGLRTNVHSYKCLSWAHVFALQGQVCTHRGKIARTFTLPPISAIYPCPDGTRTGWWDSDVTTLNRVRQLNMARGTTGKPDLQTRRHVYDISNANATCKMILSVYRGTLSASLGTGVTNRWEEKPLECRTFAKVLLITTYKGTFTRTRRKQLPVVFYLIKTYIPCRIVGFIERIKADAAGLTHTLVEVDAHDATLVVVGVAQAWKNLQKKATTTVGLKRVYTHVP